MAQIEKMIAKTFMDIANGLGNRLLEGARTFARIAVTGLGSEAWRGKLCRGSYPGCGRRC